MARIVESTSSALRLAAAREFIVSRLPHAEVLIVGASRGAADDLAQDLATRRGATFGLYRYSLIQLAARLAAPALARDGLAPTTGLGALAVTARALFEAHQAGRLGPLDAVASTPGFPSALARTLDEIAQEGVAAETLRGEGRHAADLSLLLDELNEHFAQASAANRVRFLTIASQAAAAADYPYARCHLVLLDVGVMSEAERRFVEAIISRAPDTIATVPAGDASTTRALQPMIEHLERREPDEPAGLDRLRRHLFDGVAGPARPSLSEVELFSAPGEGRECVEIARRLLREARRGVRFDRMAIVLRVPHVYAGLLEHALRRAGIPAFFDRGVRRPHPAGRAFLSLLACAAENLSAARFAEYLSLGQVPDRPVPATDQLFPASTDEIFGALAERHESAIERPTDPHGFDGVAREAPHAPWRWERLLVESRVIAGADRWPRRMRGSVEECELQRRELARSEPDSPRIPHLERKIADLMALVAFALPMVRSLAQWPAASSWEDWLDRFDDLARRALARPDRVLRVLADLRPMGAIAPVPLPEAVRVLSARLSTIEVDMPARRYGCVYVAGAAHMRGRSFDVVFVPGLAERMFPEKLREDPLLLDDLRRRVSGALVTMRDRSDRERLYLRLAVGAAQQRLYASFPTLEMREGRPRVPSLYALELWRAMTGRVPAADELQQAAARASQASLAWPAPDDPDEAIDPFEHDLATLRRLVGEAESRARGRAQYILQLNEALRRSVRERFMRGQRAWSHWDGLTRVTAHTEAPLKANQLTARPYSPSSLQRYSICPYQFLLGAIYRLRPAEDFKPLQRLDPLTKGSLFHAIQTTFYRRFTHAGEPTVTPKNRDRALLVLDEAIALVADDYRERLAPAVDRVWRDEVAAIRRDLRLWVDAISRDTSGWMPIRFEWSFGLSDEGRDPESIADPVRVDGRFPLRGSIDLVEERATTHDLRVTDHKTGKYRGTDHIVVGGGAVLQPVLYGLVLEAATGQQVAEGRLYYATTDGGYRDVPIALTAATRRAGVEVLEIIDRAVATGFLPPVPSEKACTWCDFRPVCGPNQERRARLKTREPLADLLALRGKP